MKEWKQVAEKTYITSNIHDKENEGKRASLRELPTCCVESADLLQQQREEYEKYGVFSQTLIDGVIEELNSYKDGNLREECKNNPELLKETVKKYFYCG